MSELMPIKPKKYKKMKNETEDFIIAFLFDIVFFAICVCIWLYLRKNRDENKISDNIYVLNNQTHSEIKADKESSTVKEEESNTKRRKRNRFRTFLNIKDDKIVNTEIKYYLFFLKANRNIIFSLCILGTFLVLPLYLSLPRNDINNPSFFHYISAGSISDINILTILFFITIIYSAISYTFIYLLWKKIQPSKKKTKKFLPQNFTIMVSRIDKNEINAYNIYKYFCNLTNNKVVSAYLILDYSIVYHEQKKIFNATKNLKMLKENEEKKNIKRDRSKRFLLKLLGRKKGSKVDPKADPKVDSKGKFTSADSPLQLQDGENANPERPHPGGCTPTGPLTKEGGTPAQNTAKVDTEEKTYTTEKHPIEGAGRPRGEVAREWVNPSEDQTSCQIGNTAEECEAIHAEELSQNEQNKKKKKKKNKPCAFVDLGSDIEGSKCNEDGEAYYGQTIGENVAAANLTKEVCKRRNKRSEMNGEEKAEEQKEDGRRRKGSRMKNQASFLKDTSDEDDHVQSTKMKKKKNSNKNYTYKLDIEDENLMSNNNEMLFYDLENLSTKENDNLDLNYQKKNRYRSESKRNIFHKLFFFFKKNKKSHWKKKLKEHLIKFYSIKNETPKKSTGVCFVSFIDTKSVHDCIHNIPFTGRSKWIISNAPPNYDIIWKNLKNHSYKVCARFIILNALLLLANTIIILTVTSIDNILKLKIKRYRQEDPSSGNLSAILITWLSPFIVILVNSIIQPALIACVSIAIGFIRKSSEHTYVLQGNFIFLILNTIIIPLLSLSPLSSLIKVMYSDEIGQWSTRLGAYLFNSSGFFAMRYLLHCCFLTCANQLLQIPQFSIRSIVKTVTKKETSPWTFDFGYWYGFNTTILALILTFSVAVPFILPLGSLYFFFRYHIDKYNLIYEICRTNLDSHGAIIRTAIKFMLFSVAFFQLVMFTFFSRVQNKFLSVGRNILFLSSSLTTLLVLCRSTEWVSTNHIKRKKGKRTFCYLCEKNVYVSNLKDLNKLKYAYANPYEAKR
ncbi:hypothetical protein C922_04979 [Plasmodium inui San Antonio 1]|uniref:CSC1/OSCA1-like 7TM region domain-containing protein n=1 Tax=Plasmodium inui San Antonio 1 TaxID=1237626 RepID=W6ZZE4_9APIC|nr:hypothetical protein C922_04979 [Plasmodium inui San Antonio 1]EUD64633.1 hypothetical protein C922_04979 [Plasmodium inui San Antonio 1]